MKITSTFVGTCNQKQVVVLQNLAARHIQIFCFDQQMPVARRRLESLLDDRFRLALRANGAYQA